LILPEAVRNSGSALRREEQAVTPGEAIEGVFKAWQQLDGEALLALFTEDAHYEDPLFPEPLVGSQQLHDSIAPSMADLDNCVITTLRVVESDDTGMVEAEFRSRLADGKGRLDFDFAMVVELRDGRIARLAEYFDTRTLV
jgi:ketosteroid isomerase-like protein